MDKQTIIRRILKKLVNKHIWQNKHTELKNLIKACPRHIRGEKVTKKAMKELVDLGFLNLKVSTNETHVSLNIKKKREIILFIKQKLI